MAMDQKPTRLAPSEHPNPTTKIGPTPRWYQVFFSPPPNDRWKASKTQTPSGAPCSFWFLEGSDWCSHLPKRERIKELIGVLVGTR